MAQTKQREPAQSHHSYSRMMMKEEQVVTYRVSQHGPKPSPWQGGVDATPEVFCNASQTVRQMMLTFCIAYRASFVQLLEKN